MKPIRLSKHAQSYFETRGFSEEEVVKSIQSSEWLIGDLGKLEARTNFAYNAVWNKKYYEIKQIRPIFVEEEEEIVVITVYTYFFRSN